ncbi:hypothetical protein LCGC14_0313500 [marine sediment metagenome]|uniref:Uncharacterized protein n=1 Tax=marine sediment metagenome TaxID=412755 RepID=A0A0F9WTC8_9ZZZZ
MPDFKIDNVAMTNPPARWRIGEPAVVSTPTSAHGKIIQVLLIPGVISATWGEQNAVIAAIAELRAKRGMIARHVLSFTKEGGTGLYHRNVVIPLISVGQGDGGVVETFSLDFEEYNPFPALAVWEFYIDGTIVTGDGKAKIKMPAGGRILKVKGFIEDVGTGAGQTRIQVSNGATDYLTTRGDFVVASATGLLENQVLAASPTFDRNDTLELDVDGIPGNSDSKELLVTVFTIMYGA